MIRVAAIDFETYYDAVCSIKTLGTWHYLNHPDFDAYMVSIVTNTGINYVGSPSNAPWDEISGDDYVWVSHNRSFDQAVYEHIRPGARRANWHCTADLCSYLGYPRTLSLATAELYGQALEKSIRDKMKGKRLHDLSPEEVEELKQYALNDSVYCMKLWLDYSADWPEWERNLSKLTQEMAERGVYIDKERLERYIGNLRRLVWAAHNKIPWVNESPALSYKALVEECRKAGIPPPPDLDSTSEGCAAWEDTYGEKYPWVYAMRTKRRANTQLKKFETIYNRIRPDGRVGFPLKYCGASTRRWSGDGGMNSQNMTRDAMLETEMKFFGVAEEGVDLRACVAAPEGKKLVACDLSQIEPRVLAWLVGDREMLDIVRSGIDIYEAHARATMGYKEAHPLREHSDTNVRRLAKARCLAGPTLVVTSDGYKTIRELYSTPESENKPGLQVWDGSDWVSYDDIIITGHEPVSNYSGDWFTEDHEIFTEDNQTEQVGAVYSRQHIHTENWRQPPGGDWADVWMLARFVGKTCKTVLWSRSKTALHGLWEKLRQGFVQLAPRKVHPLRVVRNEKSLRNEKHQNMGAVTRQVGLDTIPTMGCNNAQVQ